MRWNYNNDQEETVQDLSSGHRTMSDGKVERPLGKLLLKPEEAAALLSVGRSRVYELMAAAKLESVRIGGSRRIPVAALDAFVKQLQEDAAAGRWWQR